MTFVTYPDLGRCGRLGNQLHQIASTIGLARKHGARPQFPPDWIYRPFLSLPDEMYGTEPGVCASDLATDLNPQERPYLQSVSLWWDVRDEVLACLQPSVPALNALRHDPDARALDALPKPILAVHVRRGDNAHDPWTADKHLYHPLRPLAYYETAMDHLRASAGSVAVFGDDPEWNRANLRADWFSNGVPMPIEQDPAYATTAPWDWLDLFMMVRCHSFVLSNSTFGAWAAILSGAQTVLFPENWYGPIVASYADASRMMLPHWTEWPCPLPERTR